MIDRLSIEESCIYVYVSEISLKNTRAFTHGGLVFDLAARTVSFGKLSAVALPDELALVNGATLNFHLIAPDGTLRKQTRSGVLKSNEMQPGILRIAGMAKTASKFLAADGWGHAVYKYRAYFAHPGINADGEIPEWLKESITRQRFLWNRLAWLCREARRKCTPAATEEIIIFVQGTILPAIDAFNESIKSSKEIMKHPAKLKIDAPGVDGLWRFANELRKRIEKGRPVPDGLIEKVVDFANQFKTDYAPLNQFLSSYMDIAKGEAAALVLEKGTASVKLRQYEKQPTISTCKAVLDRRKTTKPPWSEGWPLIKYSDSPKARNWGLHYSLNKAGVDSALIETGKGVQGLSLGPPLNPSDTGHPLLNGVAANRKLREANISIPGENGERRRFCFGVLQHRPLPDNSHIKEWKLLFKEGKPWLCLVIELQRPVPVLGSLAAGLEIGWRRTEEGIRFGTLYEPTSKTFRELIIDLRKSPKDASNRTQFRIDLGPTRWEKRNVVLLFPDWKPEDPIPSSFETRAALNARRACYMDTAKIQLRKHLGKRLPEWFDKAGSKGLLKLAEEHLDDPVVQEIIKAWWQKEEQLGNLVSMYLDRLTKRIEYGHNQVAHDVCRYLRQKGITRLIAQTSFLTKTSQRQDIEDPVSLKLSQKYRQFVAVGKFMTALRNIAAKYGIVVDVHEAYNTTRICQYCNCVNPRIEKEQFICEGCRRQVKQNQNASVNLSRFATDPELAAWAFHAKRT
jgi:Putative transposase DNA-binding domain